VADPVSTKDLVQFLPLQHRGWEALHKFKYVLLGGNRGPGKSYWLRWSLLLLLLEWAQQGHKNVRVALFCETFPELRKRQIRWIKAEFPAWLGEIKSTQEEGLAFYIKREFGGGAIYLLNLDEPDKYKSAEFAAIGVDELTQNKFETFDVLKGSLRWVGIQHSPFLSASNPDGIGHQWVKDIWVSRDFSKYPKLGEIKDQFIYLPGKPKDNMYLPDSYWDTIESIENDALRKAWLLGDWDAFQGQVFNEWRRGDPDLEDGHVIRPQTVPAHWRKWRAMDWGYSAPWCVLWFAKNPDNGRVWIYRELYQTELTDRQQARTIREHTPEVVSFTLAPPELWARKNAEDKVTSTADEYAGEGVPLTVADNSRIAGWRRVHNALAKLPDGIPGLQVFETCTQLIRTLPSLPYDKVNVEDVNTDAEDHAADALRYGLTDLTLPKPPTDDKRQKRARAEIERVARKLL